MRKVVGLFVCLLGLLGMICKFELVTFSSQSAGLIYPFTRTFLAPRRRSEALSINCWRKAPEEHRYVTNAFSQPEAIPPPGRRNRILKRAR